MARNLLSDPRCVDQYQVRRQALRFTFEFRERFLPRPRRELRNRQLSEDQKWIPKVYFHALATDYDGTLAHGGVVSEEAKSALRRLKDSGRRLILVTGRELGDLQRVYRDLRVFDRVVAENGAVLYEPARHHARLLADPPPELFVQRLRERRVEPLSVGRVIVATSEPEEKSVLQVIRDLGLELQIIFNKGAVMVLPPGVNKASGLSHALDELGLSAHHVIGVGDAENDHAFIAACGCSAAVANALPSLKQEADLVLGAENSAGVVELIRRVIEDETALVARAGRGA